jgi:Bacterial export proteins, family 1.
VTVLFLLLFARVGALCMLMPGLGEQSISTRVRLGLALLLTIVFYPVLSNRLPAGLANDMNRLIFASSPK